MRLLFFQNCISPHQMPYIKELPGIDGVGQVVVVAPRVDYDERKAMGWNADSYLSINGLSVIIAPTDEEVCSLLADHPEQSVCLFSGISAFPEVKRWVKLSLRYSVRRCIVSEPPFVYGHALWMHRLRAVLQDARYTRHFSDVFVMGGDYGHFFQRQNRRWTVHQFLYCTEWRERRQHHPSPDGLTRLLYVGALSPRKDVGTLFRALALLPEEQQKAVEVGIVGGGEDLEKLKTLSSAVATPNSFHGVLPMQEVAHQMEKHDVLVLPSLWDGWGAVVNEALTLGLYVVVSDRCGAKMLIESDAIGRVFRAGDARSLADVLHILPTAKALRESIPQRIAWAREHISGKVVAQRMVKALMG